MHRFNQVRALCCNARMHHESTLKRIAQLIGERGLSEHLCLWAGCPEKALIGLRECARHLANGSLEIKAAG